MTFPIYHQGKILFRNGVPAFGRDCCCGDPCLNYKWCNKGCYYPVNPRVCEADGSGLIPGTEFELEPWCRIENFLQEVVFDRPVFDPIPNPNYDPDADEEDGPNPEEILTCDRFSIRQNGESVHKVGCGFVGDPPCKRPLSSKWFVPIKYYLCGSPWPLLLLPDPIEISRFNNLPIGDGSIRSYSHLDLDFFFVINVIGGFFFSWLPTNNTPIEGTFSYTGDCTGATVRRTGVMGPGTQIPRGTGWTATTSFDVAYHGPPNDGIRECQPDIWEGKPLSFRVGNPDGYFEV